MKFLKSIFFLFAAFVVMTAGMFFPRPVSAAPVMSIFPRSGGPGTTVNIYGTNFFSYAGENIVVYLGEKVADTSVGAIPSSGNFQTKFKIPEDTTPGNLKINVAVGSNLIASELFTVLIPTVRLNILGGAVGTVLSATCRGFTADKAVWLTTGLTSSAQLLGIQKTDSKGECSIEITVPKSPQGKLTLVASDDSGHVISTPFEIIPSVSINPEKISSGEIFSIKGSGFVPESQITVSLSDKLIGVPTVDKDGSFASEGEFPSLQAGIHLITIADQAGNHRWLTVEVISKINLSKKSGALGDNITLTGISFEPNSLLTVRYDAEEYGTTIINESGSFSYEITIPVSQYGPHVITVSDGVNINQLFYTVESEAPDAPKLLKPNNLTKISYPLDFEWESLYDVSQPLVYSMSISRTRDFQKIIFEKSGLDKSHYVMSENEKSMPNRPGQYYYWRVRANDGASNIGNWSQPLAFHVDPETKLPSFINIILGAAALAIVIVCGITMVTCLKRKKPPAN
jgi:hypothetical protein